MKNNTAKTNSYYTPGNPKRERRITKDWWDRAVLKMTTQEDVGRELEKVRKEDPKFWLRLILDSVPKQTINDNNGLQINLILSGIEGKRVIQVRPIERNALDEHETE